MTRTSDQHEFPIAKAIMVVTFTAVLCLVPTVWLVKALYAHISGVSMAVYVAVALAWSSSILGVLPVRLLGSAGVLPTVYGYFMGAMVRLFVCFGAFVFVTWQNVLPAEPMAIALVMTYVPLLFTETAMVGRYLWAKDFHPGHQLPVQIAATAAREALA